ncbi:uncharacterized protein LOC144643904 isoform X2 [Oculina patagonica]
MSAIEYNYLLFKISQRLDELNVHDSLLFMCRGNLPAGSEGNIQDALSLLKELEEQNNLGADRLEVIKGLLKSFKEWSLFGKVRKFESKRKKYNDLLENIISVLDELNDLERLVAMCKGKVSEESEGRIQDVRSLIKELEKQNKLGYDRLDTLKGILTEIEKNDLVKEVEEFEEQRNQEDESERKEDEFERRKAQAAAVVSSVGNKLIGVLNIKTVFKVVAGGLIVISTQEVLSCWSTFDQLVTAVNSCVFPAGTSLVQLTDGCVCLTVRAETLSALTTLWSLYQDGTLETRLYDFFVTDEVKQRAGGEEMEVNVTIEEQEYEKACRELISEAHEAASIGDRERIRRNSDSAVYSRSKEELPPLKLRHAETELKLLKERIAAIERDIAAQLTPEIQEACSPEEKAMKQHEKWKARDAGEKDEGTEESEISRLHKAKLMDPEKFAFVQKYLEDAQDTRSMTTEASDSGLVTHPGASELGTDEISETNKLRLKDLSGDVTQELIGRLYADEAAEEKFYRFFGLKMQDRYPILKNVGQMFPDTTVSVLKECFEALQLYDLTELLEKVRPRSLRPALTPEQVENLQRTDDRPTKYHSDVAVLVINNIVEGGNVKKDNEEKIEVFFKALNPRNEVTVTSVSISQETLEFLQETAWKKEEKGKLKLTEKYIRDQLENELPRQRKRLEEKPGMQVEKGSERAFRTLLYTKRQLSPSEIAQQELRLSRKLDDCTEKSAKLRKQIEKNIEKVKEQEKKAEKAISAVIDKRIHNQETFSCLVVFVIGDEVLLEEYFKTVLDELVVEKLSLIPDHPKLVVSPFWLKRTGKVPETLHVMYPYYERHFFTSMIEIFNKRWQTLDLISMMQELQRTSHDKADHYYYSRRLPFITIQDNLSTRLRFQKKDENSSLKETSDVATDI